MNLNWVALPLCVHLIGPSRAKRMVGLGRKEDAETLLRWGFYDEVVDADQLMERTLAMASAMSNIGSAIPFIGQHKVAFAVAAILLLTAANLRGIRESGTLFAIPTYAFMIGMLIR